MITKDKAIQEIFEFYIKSNDFNGISLSELAKQLNIEYKELLPIITDLLTEGSVSLQEGENPHIIRWGHYDIEMQLKWLKEAENNKVEVFHTIKPEGFDKEMPEIHFTSESHLLCVYPSPTYLKQHFTDTKYDSLPFTKRLALGEAQVWPAFFEINVLERYFKDPRYDFKFEDYSGQISYIETDNEPSSLRDTDQIFLKTFGLGYDEDKNRVVVAYLCDLSDLSAEHQAYWNSKIITTPCKMVSEYYENTIRGNWVFSQSMFSAVIEEHRLITEMSRVVTGKHLFRETYENEKRPKEFTFFTTPTLLNYESFVILLDKMISENINKSFFKDEVEEFEMIPVSEGIIERKPKGTLRLLDEWLRAKYRLQDKTAYNDLMAPFKEVRKERQKPAHKISEDYYDKKFFKQQMDLLANVHKSLHILRLIFQKHPLAASIEIPEWIEKGEIKNF